MSGRTVVLRWRKRRWRCGYCGSTWTETHPEIPARARMTLRFKRHLAARTAATGNFSRIASEEGVSYDSVARAHKARAALVRAIRPRVGPRVISIDEAAVRRGYNCNTVVTDVLARYVIGTIPGRREAALIGWFAELDDDVKEEIEVVILDMARFYRATISRILSHAEVVVDKFHVIRAANYTLDRVRSRVQGRDRHRPEGGRAGSSDVVSRCCVPPKPFVLEMSHGWRRSSMCSPRSSRHGDSKKPYARSFPATIPLRPL